MSLEAKVIEVIRTKYPDGIRIDPVKKLMLENLVGEPISDEIVEAVKKSMYTDRNGVSFLMESIATEDVIKQISSSIIDFVDRFSKYEPEAFYDLYKGQINTSIIRNANDFQDFVATFIPKRYSTKTLVRLRGGQGLEHIVEAVEDLVIEQHVGCVSLDSLKQELPGFTESRLVSIITTKSRKLILIDDPSGYMVETLDLFGFPEDFIDVFREMQEKLASYGIEINYSEMNSVLSLHYDYNFYEEHGLTPETLEKIIRSIDAEESDD